MKLVIGPEVVQIDGLVDRDGAFAVLDKVLALLATPKA